MTDDAPAGEDELSAFWESARLRAGLGRLAVVVGPGALASVAPPAWAFGDDAEVADDLLALVLEGIKQATSMTLAEVEAAGETLPHAGDLGIVLDGAGRPRALVRTTQVDVVRFDEVDDAHAALEGEGDGTLAGWRAEHESFWARVLEPLGLVVDGALLVVLERFELLHPVPGR